MISVSRVTAVRTSCAVLLLTTLLLAACGGGGGSGGSSKQPDPASLSLSTRAVTVSAVTTDSPPTATVGASITTSSTDTFYVAGSQTTQGIDSVSLANNGSGVSINITFKSPASLGIGAYVDTITVRGCRDQACTQQITNSPQTISVTYNVTAPQPHLSNLNPQSVTAGAPAFTLQVLGDTFSAQSSVLWNGSPRPTSFQSTTQLSAQISAADVAASGNVSVTVVDGAFHTAAATFVIQPLPALALQSLSPSRVAAGGGAFNLTVTGAGFTGASVIDWNGAPLPTSYLSGTTLRASVAATLIASAGTASVTVVNPANLGGTSAALTLTIDSPSIDAVSYQMNPAHTGAVNFRSASLPASFSWSVDLGGPSSYAIIVGGKVIVTTILNGNSQLRALNATNGATVWGPIAITGAANATYDSGKLFVVSGSAIFNSVISALDVATGNPLWSASVSGGWFPTAPVAAGGIVYALNGGTVNAFDESNGATLWVRNVSGTDGTVAVTADGVYSSAPCTTYDLQPATGAVIWTDNTGCEGGGGSTPIVADGVLYSPIGGFFSGNVYDAEVGTLLGNFSANYGGAVSSTTQFFLSNSTLQGIARSNNQILWSFAGDGTLDTVPVTVNNYVFVGSGSGNLYAVDATTGTPLWTQNLGAAIQSTALSGFGLYTGLAAGDGLLVVPSGTAVTAYVLSTNP